MNIIETSLHIVLQHIKKQKLSDAELTYGSLSVEATEQMKEVRRIRLMFIHSPCLDW